MNKLQKYVVRVTETVNREVFYWIEAHSPREAGEKARVGDTYDEQHIQDSEVVNRTPHLTPYLRNNKEPKVISL